MCDQRPAAGSVVHCGPLIQCRSFFAGLENKRHIANEATKQWFQMFSVGIWEEHAFDVRSYFGFCWACGGSVTWVVRHPTHGVALWHAKINEREHTIHTVDLIQHVFCTFLNHHILTSIKHPFVYIMCSIFQIDGQIIHHISPLKNP